MGEIRIFLIMTNDGAIQVIIIKQIHGEIQIRMMIIIMKINGTVQVKKRENKRAND